jgi:hypothetical protein
MLTDQLNLKIHYESMKLLERMKDETIVFLLFPLFVLVTGSIMGANLYNSVMVVAALTVAFFMYVVIRWAFFDKTSGLGKTAHGMWRRSYND